MNILDCLIIAKALDYSHGPDFHAVRRGRGEGESSKIPCLTHQKFLGMLIDLVTIEAHRCFLWHFAWRTWVF